jgi:large conductance mechanosensitive channel
MSSQPPNTRPQVVVSTPPGMLGDFQRFLIKSNAIALALGVIIGAATGQVVNSIVNDLINPIIGALFAGVDLSSIKIVLGTTTDANGNTVENAILIGNFISVLINYIITMFVVYIIAKIVAKQVLEK